MDECLINGGWKMIWRRDVCFMMPNCSWMVIKSIQNPGIAESGMDQSIGWKFYMILKSAYRSLAYSSLEMPGCDFTVGKEAATHL